MQTNSIRFFFGKYLEYFRNHPSKCSVDPQYIFVKMSDVIKNLM